MEKLYKFTFLKQERRKKILKHVFLVCKQRCEAITNRAAHQRKVRWNLLLESLHFFLILPKLNVYMLIQTNWVWFVKKNLRKEVFLFSLVNIAIKKWKKKREKGKKRNVVIFVWWKCSRFLCEDYVENFINCSFFIIGLF